MRRIGMIRNVMNPMVVYAIVLSTAMIGCAVTDNDTEDTQGIKAGIAPDAVTFVLTVGGQGEAGTQITADNISAHCPAGGICNFPFFPGTALKIQPDFTKVLVDCLQFAGWQGACAGPFSTTCN